MNLHYKRINQLSLAVAAVLASASALGQSSGNAPLDTVVVTGTRAEPRSVGDSTVPIDVIAANEFANQGDTDMSSLLRNSVPSYNVNAQPISDAASIVRPANLRGLAPDHTLVLVNGKRRHRAAVIYWIGNGVADGAQGPDISAIPTSALKQVEVLRDGAAAQYGSDAIAGVINFILKDSNEGASVEARYGSFYAGDGKQYSVSGNLGLPFIGDDSFINLSFEYGNSDPTDRSVQRDDAALLVAAGNTAVLNPVQVWGSPEIKDEIKFWANAGVTINDNLEAYGHGNYVQKTAIGGFYYRNPNTRSGVFSNDNGATLLVGDLTPGTTPCPVINIVNNVPNAAALNSVRNDANCFTFYERFPGGFTPQFGGDLTDYSLLGGIRGTAGEKLRWDASVGMGHNEVQFFIDNTVNASMGANSPTSFDPGAYRQEELGVNFDVSYPLNDRINLAAGAEYRDETFEIDAGQPESWREYQPLAAQGFSVASNGFPGFSDESAGSWSRSNYAVYGEVEFKPIDNWTLDLAVRWEDFEDFGSTTNYKIATNWRVAEPFALRGSFSTGFRAPTPGQSNASNVTTQFDTVRFELVNNGTIPSTNPVARLRGGLPLEPEESKNFSLGAVLETGPFNATIDWFSIKVEDRLSVSQDFSLTPAEVAALVASGITSAANLTNFRFFTNDFDTETTGIDFVGTYTTDISSAKLDLSLAYNHTETEVTSFNAATLSADRIKRLEEGLPRTRYSVTANLTVGDWRFLLRESVYSDWYDGDDGNSYDGSAVTDVEVAYSLDERWSFLVGAQNVFDDYPQENPNAAATIGNKYSQFAPMGFNGGFWYFRVGAQF